MTASKRTRTGMEKDPDDLPEGRLNALLARTHAWLAENRFTGPARMAGRIRLLALIVSDWHTGRYRRLPVLSVWAIIFALLYLVSPIDLVPDIIPGLGWLDDAFVVGLVFRAVSHDLRRYCEDNELDPKPFGL